MRRVWGEAVVEGCDAGDPILLGKRSSRSWELGKEEVGGGGSEGGGGDGWVAPGAAVDVENPGSSFFFFFSCGEGGWVWSGWGGRGGEPDGEGLQGQGGVAAAAAAAAVFHCRSSLLVCKRISTAHTLTRHCVLGLPESKTAVLRLQRMGVGLVLTAKEVGENGVEDEEGFSA